VDITLAELKRSPLYSEQLGIDLTRDDEQELFKWFLASRPISLPSCRLSSRPSAWHDAMMYWLP